MRLVRAVGVAILLALAVGTTPAPAPIAPPIASPQVDQHYHSQVLENNAVVSTVAGSTLRGFYCNFITGNIGGACIAYNSTTVPTPGALNAALVLDGCAFDTTAGGCSLSRLPAGINASNGIVILVSTAASPFTWTQSSNVTAFIGVDY